MRKSCVALFAIALGACGAEPELTPEQVRAQGQAALDRAIEKYRAGDVQGSWRDYHEAVGIAESFAVRSATREDRDAPPSRLGGPPDGPAGEWVEAWQQEYRHAVEVNWTVMRDAIRDETMNVASLKGFASEMLGQRGIDRVNSEYRLAEPLLLQRRAGQFWFDCEGDPEICNLLYTAVRGRMGARVVTQSWTGNRRSYLGILEARVDVTQSVAYRSGNETAGGLPKVIAIRFQAAPHQGSSPWSAPFSSTLELNPPAGIERGAFIELRNRHFEQISQMLQERLAAWPG